MVDIASILVGVGAIVTAVLAFVTSRRVDKRAARRDEFTLLREEVARLQLRVDELTTTNDDWRKKYDILYQYVLVLRKVLIDNRLDVPEMPIFDTEAKSDENPDAFSHPPVEKHKK